MRLPRPDREYGHYQLEDGSRVYQSSLVDEESPGVKFFLWRATGKVREGQSSKRVYTGEVVLTKTGILYFETPQQALDYLIFIRKGERK